MHIKINFNEPSSLHPGSDTATIAEVATHLENKYHLLENFCAKHAKDFAKVLVKWIKRNPNDFNRALAMLEQEIQNKWREYIVNAEHGLSTKASSQRGSEPFIDTGAYYRNMRVTLKIEF